MTPQHDFSKRPPQLFWLDESVLRALIQPTTREGHPEKGNEVVIFTQIEADRATGDKDHEQEGARYPLKPTAQSVGEFKTTPMVHAGYAATWFGLSGAGVYMTRKLILRGRG